MLVVCDIKKRQGHHPSRGRESSNPSDFVYVIGEKAPYPGSLNSKVHERGKYTDLQKVMIIGGGKTGFYLAEMLSEFGAAVKIIEAKKKRCHYLSAHLEDVMILHGDATDLTLLEEENLDMMDAVVTATGFDEDNLLLALTAKQHGVDDVIGKGQQDKLCGNNITHGHRYGSQPAGHNDKQYPAFRSRVQRRYCPHSLSKDRLSLWRSSPLRT